MKRPKPPCTRDCPDRAPGCHSELCTHGWVEYDKALKAYYLLTRKSPDLSLKFQKILNKRGDGIN